MIKSDFKRYYPIIITIIAVALPKLMPMSMKENLDTGWVATIFHFLFLTHSLYIFWKISKKTYSNKVTLLFSNSALLVFSVLSITNIIEFRIMVSAIIYGLILFAIQTFMTDAE